MFEASGFSSTLLDCSFSVGYFLVEKQNKSNSCGELRNSCDSFKVSTYHVYWSSLSVWHNDASGLGCIYILSWYDEFSMVFQSTDHATSFR